MKLKREWAAIVLIALLGATGAVAAEVAPAGTDLVAAGYREWESGRMDEARRFFEHAIAVNPRSVDAHMKLAGLLLSNRRYADAIPIYQKLISLDANNAKAWIALGLAYRHTSQPELSRAAFAEALRLEPARQSQLAALVETPRD
jgi:tetratricopeptide (TPR) repeat protein